MLNFNVILLSIVSGILIKLSSSISPLGYLVLISYLPVLFGLKKQSTSAHVTCGAIMGAFIFSGAPVSLSAWSFPVMIIPFSLSIIAFALIFYIYGVLTKNSFYFIRWAALPLSWAIVSSLFTHFFYLPISLSANLALTDAQTLIITRYIGGEGLDFLILLSQSAAFYMLDKRQYKVSGVIVLGLIICALFLPRYFIGSETHEVLRIRGVHPATNYNEYAQSKMSVAKKKELEDKIDRLLLRAGDHGYFDGLVLLPEGGNETFNKRIGRRQEIMKNLSIGNIAEYLIAQYDLDAGGNLFNVVTRYYHGEWLDEAQKSILVPFAEKRYSQGNTMVLNTTYARVGISICFESLFTHHIHKLYMSGLDLLYAPSDQNSFSATSLSDMHLAYSLLRAMEANKPLVFLANMGPALVSDNNGKILFFREKNDSEYIFDSEIPLLQTRSFYHDYLIGYTAILSIILITFVLLTNGISARAEIKFNDVSSSVVLLFPIIFGAVGFDIVTYALINNYSPLKYLDHITNRIDKSILTDQVPRIFKQQFDNTCGAASIAFALTILGDYVFEHDVINAIGDPGKYGYSLVQLKLYAESRGFQATGYHGEWDNLNRNNAHPSILSVDKHFIVVTKHDSKSISVFDPMLGSYEIIAKEEFSQRWDGNFLLIKTK